MKYWVFAGPRPTVAGELLEDELLEEDELEDVEEGFERITSALDRLEIAHMKHAEAVARIRQLLKEL